MADVADIANDIAQTNLDHLIANQLAEQKKQGTEFCVDCGIEIPAERREKAPWATRCVSCQEIEEVRARR